MLSISLYASLGFEVKEPLLLMRGKPNGKLPPGITVRPLQKKDLGECAALCKKVHGFERFNELQNVVTALTPVVALREDRITAYALALNLWPRNHAVAETEEDMKALLLGAAAMNSEALPLFLPMRQASLFRWCLSPGASSSHADDADGAGRVWGTQRLSYPVGSLLNAAEQQTTGAHIWSQALKPSFRLSRSTARRSNLFITIRYAR